MRVPEPPQKRRKRKKGMKRRSWSLVKAASDGAEWEFDWDSVRIAVVVVAVAVVDVAVAAIVVAAMVAGDSGMAERLKSVVVTWAR